MSIPKKMNDYKTKESMTFVEPIGDNINYFKIIKDNFDGVYDIIGKFKDKNYKLIEDRKKTKTIINKRLNNEYNEFVYTSTDEGRLIPESTNYYSLCTINKILRHTLAGNLCYDIDISNAHPTFLLWIAKYNNKPCKHLENYIINRNDILNQVQDFTGYNLDESKDYILSLLFDQNKYIDSKDPVYDFYQEILSLQNFIAETFTDIYKKSKKKGNQKGSCLSKFLQIIENKICQCMIDICKENNVKVYAPCYDGFLGDKEDIDSIGIDEFIKKIEIEIKDRLDISIILKSKSMTLGINKELDDIKKSNSYKTEGLTWIEDFVFNNNDLKAAEIISEKYNDTMFYTKGYGWVCYNDKTKFWDINCNKSTIIVKICKFFNDELKKAYSHLDFSNEKNKELKILFRHVSSTKFGNDVYKLLEGLLPKDDNFMDNFDNQPNLIAFKNGYVIDLHRNGESREICKTDYLTIHTDYNLPIRNNVVLYEVYEVFRSMVNTEDELNSYLSCLATFIYGSNKNELFYNFIGNGGNGKGLTMTSMRATLGSYFKPLTSKRLTTYDKTDNGMRADSELFNIRNARCVIASEPDENENEIVKYQVSTIKRLTGRDPITCRELHKSTVSFVPKFVLGMLTNIKATLSSDDGGIKRRMKFIHLPFHFITDKTVKLTKENEKYGDEKLKDRVQEEDFKGQFMLLLVDTWIRNNGKYYECDTYKSYTNEYFNSQNVVRDWFFDNYTLSEKGRSNYRHIKNHFNSESGQPLSDTKFGKYLKEICEGVKTGGQVYYKCIRREPIE
jgi:phage/plasmid-associated DNA primase